ncbi:MAG: class I SAM-dependent methyltransferase [Proteobacteria bacterium]|nr:class I SAM-dependent methyltransferase [Pseudomonadota bacterium]
MKNGHFITRLLELGAGIYDPLLRLSVDERRFRGRLTELAELKGDEQVLDIGCGTGTLDLMLFKLLDNGSICGIDVSSEMVKQAKRKTQRSGCKINYKGGNAKELPYKSDVFDVVFTSLMYHHLTYEEKEETLKEIHRVLKLTGRYISAEFGPFPDDFFHRMFIRFTRSSGMLQGLYPPDLIEIAGFYVVQQMDGPLLGGHHPIIYRVLRRDT